MLPTDEVVQIPETKVVHYRLQIGLAEGPRSSMICPSFKGGRLNRLDLALWNVTVK